jgi:hypothetical protein
VNTPLKKPALSVVDIASCAIDLCQLAGLKDTFYSDQGFKSKFEFAFNLLVDAQYQLDNLKTHKN